MPDAGLFSCENPSRTGNGSLVIRPALQALPLAAHPHPSAPSALRRTNSSSWDDGMVRAEQIARKSGEGTLQPGHSVGHAISSASRASSPDSATLRWMTDRWARLETSP